MFCNIFDKTLSNCSLKILDEYYQVAPYLLESEELHIWISADITPDYLSEMSLNLDNLLSLVSWETAEKQWRTDSFKRTDWWKEKGKQKKTEEKREGDKISEVSNKPHSHCHLRIDDLA